VKKVGHKTKKTASGIIYTITTKSKKSRSEDSSFKFVIISGGKVYDHKHKSEVGAHKFAMNAENIRKDYEVIKVPYNQDKTEIKKNYKPSSNHGFTRGVELVFPNAPMPKGKFEILEKKSEDIQKISKVLRDKGHIVYKIKSAKSHILFRDTGDTKKEKEGKIIHFGNV